MSAIQGFPNYNQLFFDLAERAPEFIADRARKHPSLYVDRIPKGTLSNFEGHIRTTQLFHAGLGAQAGLSEWSTIQPSRLPSSGDPGFDACAIKTPKTFSYSIEPRQYRGYEAYWQSLPICVNDVRFVYNGLEQCRLITSFMGYITQSVWETWNREQYVKMAVDNGHAFILTEGGLDYDSQAVRFHYDPFAAEGTQAAMVKIPRDLQISTLNWSFFEWWQDYLGDQCPEAAPAHDGNMPIFGLVLHMRDFDNMIMQDPVLREDLRYNKSAVLFDDYRKFTSFRSYALIHDQRQIRLKLDHVDATWAYLRRVLPMRLGRATADIFQNGIPEANPEYTNAEVAIGVIFMREVLINLIPQPIKSLPTGMVFGPAPGLDGKFVWVNEYDRQTNPLRNNGFFLAHFETFPKPLMFSSDVVAFLYRRCPQTWASLCSVNYTSNTAGLGDAVSLASSVQAGDIDATTKTVVVHLAKLLPVGVGSSVTLTLTVGGAGTTATTATIVEDSLAPFYRLGFSSGTIAANDLTTTAQVTA